MNLILNTYGAYVYRHGELFRIKVEDQEKEIAASKVTSILISTGATFSTDAVKLAIEHNIDVVFVDKFGDPYARVWHGRLGSTTRIRRAQLEISEKEAGFVFVTRWITRKFDNQIHYLTQARNKRTRLSHELTEKIEELTSWRNMITGMRGTITDKRQELLGIEGSGGRIFFAAINLLLPDDERFEKRSRNPAQDAFNCLLNYAYGVLYSLVERACILAGLDPYIGFFHTDHYNKPSLVFDLIENYRIWAEETIVSLFASRKVKQALFHKIDNGITLNKEGKTTLLEPFMAFLDETIQHSKRRIKRRGTVQLDCHRFAQELLESAS